jgi:hypothetical protein
MQATLAYTLHGSTSTTKNFHAWLMYTDMAMLPLSLQLPGLLCTVIAAQRARAAPGQPLESPATPAWQPLP